jgi:hemolysin III
MGSSMTQPNFPSPILAHRRADMAVHAIGITLIVIAGTTMLIRAGQSLSAPMVLAVLVYVICALASNLASNLYHFSPWHASRVMLRRIDHAAIYTSITGTFTPLLVQAGTTRTYTVLILCWLLAAAAIYKKLTKPKVKSKWSTASYLGLGAIGLVALPDLNGVPATTPQLVLAGSACYAIGTIFYTRKSLPFRYAIWHAWVVLGGALMFAGIWLAIF